jgi:DNA-binding LytR/AlgR family response regulator
MKIIAIAIDHDRNGLKMLSEYISDLNNYELACTFTNPEQALKFMLNMETLDVLFIDSNVFSTADLDIYKHFRAKAKKIIVTSAHQENAFQVFQFEADSFLLKPYVLSKVAATLEKLFPIAKELSNRQLPIEDDFFFIKSKNEKFNLIKIRPREIISVESLQNYIAIQTTTKKVIAHLTLTKIKEILKEQDHIIQVHRSFLISKLYIEEIESNTLKMHGNLNITVGGDYKDELLSYIKKKTIQTGRIAKLGESTSTKSSA